MKRAKTLLAAFALTTGLAAVAQQPARFDVVITEIMADPSPVVGLPNAEYIEIKNTSSFALPLNGWRLSDKTSTVILLTPLVLQPDSLVILCSTGNALPLSAYGRTIGIASFPSLDNDGDTLILRSPQNKIIHAVGYAADWYRDETKAAGGWSLEIIDPQNPCTGMENWKASTHARGGTPGSPNSVNGSHADSRPPQLKNASVEDSVTVNLVFDEPLDSTSAAITANYRLPGHTIVAATPVPPLFQSVRLRLTEALQPGAVLEVTTSNVSDCAGNSIGSYNRARVGRPQPVSPADVVINEILFHPRPGSPDYVELYNRSNKVIDVSTLSLANRNSSGAVAALKKISVSPFYLFPGDYLALTENKAALALQYFVRNEDAVLQLASLPSYPNDKGTVVLQGDNGTQIDEVVYAKEWHFALISDDAGVALERIDPDAASQSAGNWHSAASTAGYGTPGYVNSQYRQAETVKATVSISPAIFSPDNDGRDDIAQISYQVAERGYVANVFLFDAAGRMVKHLVKNDLLATSGTWTWDGLGENSNRLPIGTYIVFTEIFTLEGRKKSFRNTIVLARPLN
ncbi:lamin tail domain-containing protein [Flavisolibacter nicotianae]|uniref:lamin tail domain-containing protein n=1 Tax=Flavisolibacter nicotianae TaxID=2364882 RepID=UPI0013C485F8|nr:lamin tail domain-containing protein [Flavisolibacter nicotianae]